MTRKITLAAARIQAGKQNYVTLGDLESARDWGYAKDFVQAMWLMLQQDQPEDYVLATGQSHTVKDFLKVAFNRVGLNWADHVRLDDRYIRPADCCQLLGNPEKAASNLGWKPSIQFEDLVNLMVDSDRALVAKMMADR